jgi:DNA-directed RNA polymerase II subunit RPB1
MAEPFSIATGAIQVAGAGLQLAKTLYDYLDSVKNPQKHIRAIAIEVRLTSSVLEHLGAFLKDEGEALCSENIVRDAKAAFSGCENAFNEVSATFTVLVKPGNDMVTKISIVRRVSWRLRKGKLEAMQANLERLKLTLLLMLSVLGYAKDNAFKYVSKAF